MSNEREWLDERFRKGKSSSENNVNDDNDLDSINSIDSNDTLHNFIEFQSHRNNIGLEEAISLAYPFHKSLNCNVDYDDIEVDKNTQNENELSLGKRITISTLLEEDDLVPIFDGAGWAGTRVWSAAIYGIKYLVEHFGTELVNIDDNDHDKRVHRKKNNMSLCELGCGLGVPGMIWHQLGADVVLSDQPSIMSQLKENVKANFTETYIENNNDKNENKCDEKTKGSIQAHPLDWSRDGYQSLLSGTGFTNGFDIVLNCDCIFEPLYGKSWELLVEVIDECLKHNPNCSVVTSVERRNGDGIDNFLDTMKNCEHVRSVEKICENKAKKLELYITKGNN